MFTKVCGFFHKSVEMRNSENLLQHPIMFDNNSQTVLVEMDRATHKILYSLFYELESADVKYSDDPMISAITGCHTIKCEVAELEREVTRITANNDNTRKEAVQVMTMGFKFIRDICDKEA